MSYAIGLAKVLVKGVYELTEEHFTQIVHKYSDSIFRIAFNFCRNRADSDDIVQNVLLKYYKCNKSFESEEHIRNWLIRVAVNESKKLLVSPFKKKIVPFEEIQEKIVFDKQEESDLYYAVMELGAKYRVVVYMYYYEDYSVKEISEFLGVNESTIQTRLMRARGKLREKLKEVWADEQ